MKEGIPATIVTTVDFCFRPLSIFFRAYKFFKNCNNINIQVIVGHANRSKICDFLFLMMCKKKFKNIHIVSFDFKNVKNNNSILRNISSKEVKTKFIIFSDIDLYFDSDIIKYVIIDAERNKFSILPCLYLSKFGTKNFNKDKNRINIINKWLLWDIRNVLHLAIPSSFICLEKEIFDKIHGFDEKYEGHGYEDFDFMVRLLNYYNCIKFNNKSIIDKTYIAPLFAEGFRADLAAFCIKNIIKKKIVLHLYHKKNKKTYKSDRDKNRIIFLNKISSMITCEKVENVPVPILISLFYRLCDYYNVDSSSYGVLFFNKPKNL